VSVINYLERKCWLWPPVTWNRMYAINTVAFVHD